MPPRPCAPPPLHAPTQQLHTPPRLSLRGRYEQQTAIATDNALAQLFSSPEYARWMVHNHQRMQWKQEDKQPDATEDD